MKIKSIMVDDTEHCIFCFDENVAPHHIFFGQSDRPIAEKYKLIVPLCVLHHTEGKDSPHKNRIVDLTMKAWAQTVYEQRIGDRDSFRREFKRNYL